MRFTALALSLAASLAIGHPAGAVLKHYGVHWTMISSSNTHVPNPDKYPPAKDGSTRHSFPTYICTYAGDSNLATVDPQWNSPFYDLGTWTFHGTGFTSVPFIHQDIYCGGMCVANAQYHLRGRLASGLVPAVPVLGVALLGASLLFAGARLARGRSR